MRMTEYLTSTTLRPSLSRQFASCECDLLEALVARLVPCISDLDIARIQRIVEHTQLQPPADPERFTMLMNRLLTACELVLLDEKGHPGRLYCCKLPSGKRYIRMIGGREMRGRFRRELVTVARAKSAGVMGVSHSSPVETPDLS